MDWVQAGPSIEPKAHRHGVLAEEAGLHAGPADPEWAGRSAADGPGAFSWSLDGIVVRLGLVAAFASDDRCSESDLRLYLMPGPRGIAALLTTAARQGPATSWREVADLDGAPVTVTVKVSREWAAECPQLADVDAETVLDPKLSDFLCEHLSTCIAHFPQLDEHRRKALAAASLALIAAVVAPAEPVREGTVNAMSMQMIERARLVTRRSMGSPEFDPEELCRLLAVSRSKLYRYFEPIGGVGRFIQHERLLEARRRLVDPAAQPSIQAVAVDVGFLDHSTFSRAFRRAFGYSPREARERHHAASLAHGSGDP